MGFFSAAREAKPRIEPVLRDVEPTAPAATGGAVPGSLAFPSPQMWGMFGGWSGSTGQPVTPLSALQASAVYGCVKALSEDVGKVPVRVKRRLPGGGAEVDLKHPVNKLLRFAPNVWQTPFDYFSYCTTAFLLRGNAFSAVLRGGAGTPLGLIPINPDRCAVMISPKGWLYYNVSHPQIGDGVMIHQEDMIHQRNISLDGGYLGISPIALAQDVVGITIAAQQHGAELFRQGTQISGVLSFDGTLSPEAAKRIASDWQNAYGGVRKAHKVAVLESGGKFQKMSMTSEDAQLLETRRFGVIEICRLFRVPPHKVFDLSDAHYSNMEQATSEYIDDGIEPICKRLREQMERTLFFDDERDRYYLEHDYSVLSRGDRKSRYDTHAISLTNGFKCVNEVRAEEGLNPIPGGDVYRVPLNTGRAGGNPATSGAVEDSTAAVIPPDAQEPAVPPAGTQPAENVTDV
jgi:HK97 family phage portal protein